MMVGSRADSCRSDTGLAGPRTGNRRSLGRVSGRVAGQPEPWGSSNKRLYPGMMANASNVPLDGKIFAGVSNDESGQVGASTRFRYHQDDDVIWAEYSGGEIRRGHLVGTRAGDRLSFRYVHLDADGETASGACDSRIVLLDDGRVRFEESWAWESRPGTGTSIVEEIRDP